MNQLLENAVGGGLLVLVVLLVRGLCKNFSKRVRCALWGLVGLRLLLPFSLPSVVALLPKVQPQSAGGPVQMQSNLPAVDAAVNPVLEQIGTAVQPVETKQTLTVTQILFLVWAVGALVLGVYGLICTVRVRWQLHTAVLLRENIYQSEWVASPFVMGILRPRIYVPFDVEPDAYMLAHERAHIARKDYVTKPLSFVLLCVYWFQPLLWVAYKLYAKDVELACDEKVVRQLPVKERGEYVRAMLAWAIKLQKPGVHAAFAENYLEERVHEVMTYKKPKIWVSIVSVLLCVLLAACAVLGPPESLPLPSEDPVPVDIHAVEQAEKDFDGTARPITNPLERLTPSPTAKTTLDSLEEWQAAFAAENFENVIVTRLSGRDHVDSVCERDGDTLAYTTAYNQITTLYLHWNGESMEKKYRPRSHALTHSSSDEGEGRQMIESLTVPGYSAQTWFSGAEYDPQEKCYVMQIVHTFEGKPMETVLTKLYIENGKLIKSVSDNGSGYASALTTVVYEYGGVKLEMPEGTT